MGWKENEQQKESVRFALVTAPSCFLYEKPGNNAGENVSEITDEIFSGWAVRFMQRLPEEAPKERHMDERSWLQIETHYGYRGYVKAANLREMTVDELRERQDKSRFFLLHQAAADVLAQPKVQGMLLETLERGSIVELLEEERQVSAREGSEGWCLVRTAAGRVGYLHAHFLLERKDDDGYLLRGDAAEGGMENRDGQDGAAGENSYFNEQADRVLATMPETALREAVVGSARAYLGAQYRWAGKSAFGIDCSGLTFMSYMENGILLYRDAQIRAAYPVREITREQLTRGDLIFFEGHVGMYLGNGRFIHSTGFAADACVTINSLAPEDPLYRPDLPMKILWYGSVFAGTRCDKTSRDVQTALEQNQAGEDPQRLRFTCTGEMEQIESQKESRDATAAATTTASETNPETIAQVLQEIEASLAALSGNVSFVYQDLGSQEQGIQKSGKQKPGTQKQGAQEPGKQKPGMEKTRGFRTEAPHIAASVIKLYLMAAYYLSFAQGDMSPADRLRVPARAKVPSCGVLTYLEDGKELSLRDLIELMIIVSDNTATNILFDHYESVYGKEKLNRVIQEELGFTGTSFNRKMFDSEQAARGIDNYTTAADTATLLARLYRGKLVSPQASAQMYGILREQRLNGKIPFILHTRQPAPAIAHKTGEDKRTTHDVAVIEGERPMVLCFFGNEVDVPAFERLMAHSAARLYEAGRYEAEVICR